jgi:hypothetical protein
MAEKVRVLITVKTYPLPSPSYRELVCTAGVREDGSFIRLYPIDYRYKPYWQWFRKYQWVELAVEKHRRDPRPESYKPVGDIRPLGPPLSTKDSWRERKKYVLAKGESTMCGLEAKKQKEVSLGIVHPLKVTDFICEPTECEWKKEWRAAMDQLSLFGPERKPLEKVPYKFSYKFRCEEDGCGGHQMMIEDWEVFQLYRSMRDKFGDEKVACEKVKDKFLGQICSPEVDTHFFVGTVLEHGTWIIIGAFWPKKVTI